MRKKYIEETYMRDVTESVIKTEFNQDINSFICLKYIVKLNKKIESFCNGKKYVGLDNGYTILEYLPKDKKYNCRVFFDNFNRPLLYYFDINNGNGEVNNKHWYDDLYLDVILATPYITDGFNHISLDDELELKKSFKEGTINEKTFYQAYETSEELMNDLRNGNCIIVNRAVYDIFRLKKEYNIK